MTTEGLDLFLQFQSEDSQEDSDGLSSVMCPPPEGHCPDGSKIISEQESSESPLHGWSERPGNVRNQACKNGLAISVSLKSVQ